MKILFIMDSLWAGGAERSTSDLWYFLRDAGAKVSIILLGHRTPGLDKELLAAGFDIEYLDGLSFIEHSRAIAKRVRQLKPHIVHSVLFKSNLRTRAARLQCTFTHVESLVNCTYDEIRLTDPNVGKLAFYYYKQVDKMTSSLVDHYHSITNAVKDHYVNELGIRPSKITVIYRGRSPISRGAVERSNVGVEASDFLIINTGRHEFQKGQMFLVQAMKQLVSLGHTDIKALILGKDGNATNGIRRFIEENHLEANIILGGYRSDVAAILSIGDLFAFPSLYEGLGGALIEAQAAGLPVICNSLPVLKEVVVEGQNAKMFNSHNINSIVDAILFFYNNRENQRNFGLKSRQNFESKFLLDKVNKEMLDLYSTLQGV